MKRYIKYIIILILTVFFILPLIIYIGEAFYLRPKGYRFHNYTPEEFVPAENDAKSFYNFGCGYFDGESDLPQNKEKGLSWIKKAAEMDYSDAQVTLVYLYLTGDGVPQDKEEAHKWAEKAEKNGITTIWDDWSRWEQREKKD